MSTTENTWTIHGPMGKLPVELLAFVLGKLDVPSLGRVRAVCRGIRLLATDASRGMSAIVSADELPDDDNATMYGPGWFQGAISFVDVPVTALHPSGWIGDRTAPGAYTIPTIIPKIGIKCSDVKLVTEMGLVKAQYLQSMSRIGRLTSLDISLSFLEGAPDGTVFTKLDTLALGDANVHRYSVDKFGLDAITRYSDTVAEEVVRSEVCPVLETLVVKKNGTVSAPFLASCNRQLRHLSLQSCLRLGASAISHVQAFDCLLTINLDWCRGVDDTWAAAIGGMQTLVRVSLRGCHNVTDDGVASIAGLANLQDLNLYHANGISSRSLETLSAHATLKVLNVGRTGVASAGDAMKITSKRNAQMPVLRLIVSEQVDAAFRQNERAAMEAARVMLVFYPIVVQ